MNLAYASLGRRVLAFILDGFILFIPCLIGDPMGRRISLRAAIVRDLLKWVSVVLLFVGFFFALFTPKKQALHDLLADTLVVYGRSSRSIADAWVAAVKDLFHMVPTTTAPKGDEDLRQLERLQALREKGALSEEEFNIQKRKIVSSEPSAPAP